MDQDQQAETKPDMKSLISGAIEALKTVALKAIETHGVVHAGAGACPAYWEYRSKRAEYIEGKVDGIIDFVKETLDEPEEAVEKLQKIVTALEPLLGGAGEQWPEEEEEAE